MNVIINVLGGGSEVGASCLHIQMGENSLLIDAGMRMHGDELLPALGMLEDLPKPDCILVTHAHADHIGALPIVHSLYPSVPVYATPPTADLMRVMMKDAFKIMVQRSKLTNSLPPYTIDQVNTLLDSLLPYPADGRLEVGNLSIRSYRAGHIFGAVMFSIEGGGESLLVTGDLSFKAGRTIPGAEVPHQLVPDVVVMESTYGNRTHTDRNTEERRLAEHVAEVVAGGGFALIPAFALGRAQEVLLVLQDYMDKGLIPEFPIYVDGLVTPISGIYRRYPHYLKGPVAHRIRKNGDAFLTEGRCKAVNPHEREMILKGKPGCIVASSGMLTGGASAWYAERLVNGEKNAVFITGYQDEESPGRRLLDLAEGLEQQLELNGTLYEVKCRIGKYGLSAHADASEMERFIQTLKPTHTLLVHGDDEARKRLAERIDSRYKPVLTENGESYAFEKRTSGKGVKGKRIIADEANQELKSKIGFLLLYRSEGESDMKTAICTGVHPKTGVLISQTMKGKPVRLQPGQILETVGRWNGPIDELAEAADDVLSFSRPIIKKIEWSRLPVMDATLEEVLDAVKAEGIRQRIGVALALQCFPEDRIRREGQSVVYRVTDDWKNRLMALDLPIQALKLNPTAAMEKVKSLFCDNPRFLRSGANDLGTSAERLTIYFDFPDAVGQEERQKYRELVKEETGWDVAFSDSVRQDLLQQQVTRFFGPGLGTPSIHLKNRTVSLSAKQPARSEEAIRQFVETTAFQVVFNNSGLPGMSASAATVYEMETGGKRMENNEAIEETKRWAAKRKLTIYKVGIKGEVVEVHFITPEVAARHEADLEELSWRIGRPVTYTKTPKQNEIIRITLESLPEEWQVEKNPSIHMDRSAIRIKLKEPADEMTAERVCKQIEEATGYRLEANF